MRKVQISITAFNHQCPLAFVFCSAFISADINATGIDKKEFWRFIVKKNRPIEYCINSGGIQKVIGIT